MNNTNRKLARLFSDYGMLLVLLLLCALFSVLTCTEQHPTGEAAARQLAGEIEGGARVMIAVREQAEDAAFARFLERALKERGRMASLRSSLIALMDRTFPAPVGVISPADHRSIPLTRSSGPPYRIRSAMH